jgi:hypothetical protein
MVTTTLYQQDDQLKSENAFKTSMVHLLSRCLGVTTIPVGDLFSNAMNQEQGNIEIVKY